LAAVVKVGVVSAPLKAIVPVVLVRTTLVPVVTAPVKVVPPELVMVRVPMSVPIVLETASAPSVLIVKCEALPFAVPATAVRLIGVLAPAPIMRVTPSTKVVLPNVIVPVLAPPTVLLALTVTAVSASPKVITPVPLAAIVPAIDTLLGAVATKPPV